MPILLFIDGFDFSRNTYLSIKAFYITPADLCYAERRKTGNIFTMTLDPHGATMEDIVGSFRHSWNELERGVLKIDPELEVDCAILTYT